MRASFAWGGEEQAPFRPLGWLAPREKPRDFGQMESSRGEEPASPVNGETGAAEEHAETSPGQTSSELYRDRDHGSKPVTSSAYVPSCLLAEKECEGREKKRAP
jgi:hypothetical protein